MTSAMTPKQRYRISERGRAENRERMRRRRAWLCAFGGRAAETLRRQVNDLGWALCWSCLLIHAARDIEIDHRQPLGQGGRDDQSNVQPLCISCHQDKTVRERAA